MEPEVTPEVLTKLVQDVEECRRRLEQAQATESTARSEATSALNAFNEVSRAMDRALDMYRKGSPDRTDWKSAGRRD